MKINRIQVFEYDAVWAHGAYGMSHGRVSAGHRSLVVRVGTDEGLGGWAETCPHGRTYLPSFLEGERAALGVLARALIGQDPRNPGQLNATMDAELLGSNAAKSVLDVACWDIFGQSTGLPVCDLIGGRQQESVPLFVAVPIDSLESMAAHVERDHALGVRVFQVKVGDQPAADVARVRAVLEAAGAESTVIADANGGWNLADALLAARALDGLPVRLEQPCRTFSDCAELRRHSALPLILDEVITTMDDLVRAKALGASGVNLKSSRIGGITRTRVIRDAAQALGMTFTIDDTWGGSLTTAQNAQLAASSNPEQLTATTYFSEWIRPLISSGPRMVDSGRGAAPSAPGLGVAVDISLLEGPVLEL